MSELSSFLMVSNGNVTGIANRLVEEGLVTRRTGEDDARVHILSLTETGKTQFTSMAAKHAAWVDEILSPLDDNKMQEITGMLDQIQRRVGDL